MENLLKQMVVIFLTLTISFFLVACDEGCGSDCYDDGATDGDSDGDSDSDTDSDTDGDTDGDSDSDSDSDTDTEEADPEAEARCEALADKIDDVWFFYNDISACDIVVEYVDGECITTANDYEDYGGCTTNCIYSGDKLPAEGIEPCIGASIYLRDGDNNTLVFFIDYGNSNEEVVYKRQE